MGKISTDPANVGNFQGNSPLKPEPPAISTAFFLRAVGMQKLVAALLFQNRSETFSSSHLPFVILKNPFLKSWSSLRNLFVMYAIIIAKDALINQTIFFPNS